MQPASPFVAECKTLDQATAVMTFLNSASDDIWRSIMLLQLKM